MAALKIAVTKVRRRYWPGEGQPCLFYHGKWQYVNYDLLVLLRQRHTVRDGATIALRYPLRFDILREFRKSVSRVCTLVQWKRKCVKKLVVKKDKDDG